MAQADTKRSLLPQGPWLDDAGRPAAIQALNGAPMVLTLAYGACRRVCSSTLRAMKQVQAHADRQQRNLQFVVVGLDPALDTPADWAAFRRDNGLNRGNWHFLSGSVDSTRLLASRLQVRYWRYGEHTLHDYLVVLVAPSGQVLKSLRRADEDPLALLD